MTRIRTLLVVAFVALIAVPVAQAAPRVTVSGAVTTQSTLTAKATGGRIQSVAWERCPTKGKGCTTGVLYKVGTGRSYAIQLEDVDGYLRAVATVKPRRGAARVVRSAWQGPVTIAVPEGGTAVGMEVGEYTCYSGTLLSTIWIDSASAYRSPSGTPGTYVLEPGSRVYSQGAVKINWTSGTYAEWQKTENFWAEYIPVGTPSPITGGAPTAVGKILMTFNPGDNITWSSSGWTTCDRK